MAILTVVVLGIVAYVLYRPKREVAPPEASNGIDALMRYARMMDQLKEFVPPTTDAVEISEPIPTPAVSSRLVVWYTVAPVDTPPTNPHAPSFETTSGVVSYRWIIRQRISGPDGRYNSAEFTIMPSALDILVADLQSAVAVLDQEATLGVPVGFSRPVRSYEPYLSVVAAQQGTLSVSYGLSAKHHRVFSRHLSRSEVEATSEALSQAPARVLEKILARMERTE